MGQLASWLPSMLGGRTHDRVRGRTVATLILGGDRTGSSSALVQRGRTSVSDDGVAGAPDAPASDGIAGAGGPTNHAARTVGVAAMEGRGRASATESSFFPLWTALLLGGALAWVVLELSGASDAISGHTQNPAPSVIDGLRHGDAATPGAAEVRD